MGVTSQGGYRKQSWKRILEKKDFSPWEPFKKTAVSNLEFDQNLEIDTLFLQLGLGVFDGPRRLKSQFSILPK